VFALGSNGSFTLTQTVDLGNGRRLTDFKVESDFAYIANEGESGPQGSVTVLRRDASSGQLSVANTTNVASPVGGTATLHF
jgi:hypothetical protein